jgi:hypothetical protein
MTQISTVAIERDTINRSNLLRDQR